MSLDGKPFDGPNYDAQQDFHRLNGQLQRVKALMLDGKPRTLSEIADKTNTPLSTVSSRVRDLRKEKNGSYIVLSERISRGTYVYWIPASPKCDQFGQYEFMDVA